MDKGSMPLPPAIKICLGGNMKIVVFNVDGQTIRRADPRDLLVAGTSGYLFAKFVFSKDWDGCEKVAGFSTKHGVEFAPQRLSANNTCMIPEEALKYHEFKIKVYGKRRGVVITTKPIIVTQHGGKQ